MQLNKKSGKVDKKKLAVALRANLLRRKKAVSPVRDEKAEDNNKHKSK